MHPRHSVAVVALEQFTHLPLIMRNSLQSEHKGMVVKLEQFVQVFPFQANPTHKVQSFFDAKVHNLHIPRLK
jgi:hypothetical protein